MVKNFVKKVKTKSLKIIKSPKGDIVRILRKNDLKNWNFQEAYLSKIKFRKIKAWKFHSKMCLNLIVLSGKVKFVFYSPKTKHFKSIVAKEKKYSRIIIPPKIWFGFKGLSRKESLILSLTNFLHNSKEILRRDINHIKFNW